MHRLALAIALAALAACLPYRKGQGEGGGRTRVCIQNATAGYGSITARVGMVRVDVMPGEEVCRNVMEVGGGAQLTARTIGGGANGPLTFRASLPGGSTGCWLWVLDNTRVYDNVRPCRGTDEAANQP